MAKRKLKLAEYVALATGIVALALFFIPSSADVLKRWGLNVVIAWLILTLGAALVEFLSGRSWKRMGLVTFVVAVVSGAILVGLNRAETERIVEDKKPNTKDEVFLIHHKGAVAFGDYPQPFLYEYGVPTTFLAPIGLAVDVEVVNNKPTKTKVKSYVADIQTPDGNWHRILSLPMSPPRTIYFLNLRDITRGMKCEFDPAIFDAIAINTNLDPGQPLEGWMFFEYPAELRKSTVFIKALKLTITNIQDEIAEAVFDEDKIPKPQSGESMIDSNAVFCHGKPGQSIDLSSVPIKPLRD